jgi:hypothetical protein
MTAPIPEALFSSGKPMLFSKSAATLQAYMTSWQAAAALRRRGQHRSLTICLAHKTDVHEPSPPSHPLLFSWLHEEMGCQS